MLVIAAQLAGLVSILRARQTGEPMERRNRRREDAYLDDLMKIINGTPDLPFVTNGGLTITFCGEQSTRILGRSPSDVVGTAFLDLFDSVSSHKIQGVLDHLKKEGGNVCIPVHCVIDDSLYVTKELSISSSFDDDMSLRFFGCIKDTTPQMVQPTLVACNALKEKVEKNITTFVGSRNKDIIIEVFGDLRKLCDCCEVDFYQHDPAKRVFTYIIGTGENQPEILMDQMAPSCIGSLDKGVPSFGMCDTSFGIESSCSCVIIPAVEQGITWGMLVLVSKEKNKMWNKLYIATIVSIFRIIQSLLYVRRSFNMLVLDKTCLAHVTESIGGWLRQSATEGKRSLEVRAGAGSMYARETQAESI